MAAPCGDKGSRVGGGDLELRCEVFEMGGDMLGWTKKRVANASNAWGSCCATAQLIAAYC